MSASAASLSPLSVSPPDARGRTDDALTVPPSLPAALLTDCLRALEEDDVSVGGLKVEPDEDVDDVDGRRAEEEKPDGGGDPAPPMAARLAPGVKAEDEPGRT